MKKRNLFAEIAEGFDALANERAGKQTLRTHKVELQPLPEVTAEEPGDFARAPAPVAPGVCWLPANQSTDIGELGAGQGQAECPSLAPHSFGREVPGHR